MYKVDRTVISTTTKPELCDYIDRLGTLANNLYNASLFRVRQIFTGWDKQSRTTNEVAIFNEVEFSVKVYPKYKPQKVVSYNCLEYILRANNNPDFFAGLPMQTAQNVVKQATKDFKNWLSSLKEYKRAPEKYLGKPRMPHYKKKGDICTFTISNQDAVLYPMVDTTTGEYRGMELKLPMTKHRLKLTRLPADAKLKEVKISPYYGKYLLLLTFDTKATDKSRNATHKAAIDFGTDNIATIVTTDGSSKVYKGGAIISENRLFAKEKGKAVAILTRGTKHKYATSKHLEYLSRKHDCFMHDQMHKISRDIVNYCVTHNVGTIVIGKNDNWKQKVNLGKANNQNFVSIPHAKLEMLIRFKAALENIEVITQEESYTSRADVTSNDEMPVFAKGHNTTVTFSGRRIKRGLYKTASGLVINADCNGAANILRKAYPTTWQGTTEFAFLAYPEVVDFKKLNERKHA